MILQFTSALQVYLLVCIALCTRVGVNNIHLILVEDDEISNFTTQSAQEEPQSHGNRSARVTLMK